ncbi:hypothetical protein [Microbacterium candidum]|uniref:VOC family protein n=1 Tax=Microbacterium candidum TaxID=3041922 RepID=A0ABT7MYT9_9MICO|nr:hypothetical protein [Microbacterium sp. ASV49]MDL9979592.1 hypothetical protein [Microbacterium sp. ASV49]
MITVQPIVYTSEPRRWHALAAALGLAARTPLDDMWTEFAGGGVLAIHQAERSRQPDWHALVDDLAATERALADAGILFRRTELDGVGSILHVAGTLTVSVGAGADDHGPLAVMPIWYDTDLDRARTVYRALGLAPRISSDGGGWSDFSADGGGLAALHGGDPRIELSFEYAGDLDALAKRVADAGFPAHIVDEAYNRTLLVDTPEGGKLWINGTIDDLYGYHAAG